MRDAVVQSVLCVLIAVWGIAMIVLGVVWENWTWTLLGIAVLVVGLPFARNAPRSPLLQKE